MKGYFTILTVLFSLMPGICVAGNMRTMTYDVYAGGIHALDAKLVMQQSGTNYAVSLTSSTHGMLGKLAPWSGGFESKGVLASKGVADPTRHQSRSKWKGTTETKTYTYNGKGKFVSYKVTEGDRDKTPEKVDVSLTAGSTDLLSATLTMMQQIPQSGVCAGDSLIFDGDRNYHLLFKNSQPEKLAKSKYNMFDGPAISCTVEIKPEKGKWKKKPRGWLTIQEQGRQTGALPTVWFGRVDNGKGPYIPVKIRVKTSYGILFMHLTSYKLSPSK